jgi:hypothetical protein
LTAVAFYLKPINPRLYEKVWIAPADAAVCDCALAQKTKLTSAKKTNTVVTVKIDSTKGPLKDWKEVLKDTREIKGLITMHLKRDNTLYFELDPKDLDKDLGMSLHYSKGPSEIAPTGIPALWGTRLIRFRRYGDQVALVNYNEKYTAAEGSSMKGTLESGIGHSYSGHVQSRKRAQRQQAFTCGRDAVLYIGLCERCTKPEVLFRQQTLAVREGKKLRGKSGGF